MISKPKVMRYVRGHGSSGKLSFFILLLFMASLLPVPAQASFTMGILAYVSRDYAAAHQEFEPLAEQGDSHAQYYLGQMYRNGEGVKQDFRQAFKWYKLAAQQGEVRSQHILGQMYHRGVGVIQNHGEAVRWYELAAAQGQVSSQTNLAFMYRDDVVIQDYKEAIRWFRLLAGQDHAYAHYNLGSMYRKGQGVAADNVTAHMWFNIAASAGHESARIERDEVAAKMSPAEVTRAQEMARQCVDSGYADC